MGARLLMACKWMWIMVLLLTLCVSVGQARTFIVNPDTTLQHAVISVVADSAQPGDSIMVRDGVYVEAFLSIDSAVVVFAEHHGGPLIICVTAIGITLHQSAQLLGMQILGDFIPQIHQFLVEVRGGPATIYNCQFWPSARQGVQLSLYSAGIAPIIRYCQLFTQSGASAAVQNFDTTTVWMPYNYFQRTDTVAIHRDIWDSSNGLGYGHVYITPVLDSFQWLGVDQPRQLLPVSPSIGVFPNPFNSSTHLEFTLPSTQRVSLRLYDVLGREVAVMMDEIRTAGKHEIRFDAAGLASGVYLCRLEAGGMGQTRKMVLIK